EKSGTESKSVEMLAGAQKGIWALLQNTLAVSWIVPAQDDAARDRVKKDIESVTASLNAILPKYVRNGENAADWIVHEGVMSGGDGAKAAWDRMLAEAQLQWHQSHNVRTGAET
ncbi:MAG: molecular chaperone TorD, partial [Deltaproteobacteria bacterium]|nr:molecular chaperone TorD [Deltaproteobacteria bacterium]